MRYKQYAAERGHVPPRSIYPRIARKKKGVVNEYCMHAKKYAKVEDISHHDLV